MNSDSNLKIDARVSTPQREQGPLTVSPPAPPPKESKPVFSPRASVAAMMITNGSPRKPAEFSDLDLLLPPPPPPPPAYEAHPPSSPLSMPDFAAFGSSDEDDEDCERIKMMATHSTTGNGATTTAAAATIPHATTCSRLGRSITITTSHAHHAAENNNSNNNSCNLGTKPTEGSGNGTVVPRPPRSVASPGAPRAERNMMQRSLRSPSTTAGSSCGSSLLDSSMRDSVRSELGQRSSQHLASSRTGLPPPQRGRSAAKPGGVGTTRSRSHRRVAVSDGFADAPASPPSPQAVVLPTDEDPNHSRKLNIRVLHQHTHHHLHQQQQQPHLQASESPSSPPVVMLLLHQGQTIAHDGPPLPPADFGQIRPMTGPHRRLSQSTLSTAAAPTAYDGANFSTTVVVPPPSSPPQQRQPSLGACVVQRSHSVVVRPSEPRPATLQASAAGDVRAAMARSATVVPTAALPSSCSTTPSPGSSSPSKGALSLQSARALAMSQSSLASGGTHFMSLSGSSSPAAVSPHLFTSPSAPELPSPNLSRSSSNNRVPLRGGDMSVSAAAAAVRDRESDEDETEEPAFRCPSASGGPRRRSSASKDYTRAPYDNDHDAFHDDENRAEAGEGGERLLSAVSTHCFMGDFVCAVPTTVPSPPPLPAAAAAAAANKHPSSSLLGRPVVVSPPPPATTTTVNPTATTTMLSPPTLPSSCAMKDRRSSFSLILHSDWRTVFVASSAGSNTITQVSSAAVSAPCTQSHAPPVAARAGSGVGTAAAGGVMMQSSMLLASSCPAAAGVARMMTAPKDIMSGAGSSLTSNSMLATMMLSSSGTHVAIVPTNSSSTHLHPPTVTLPGTALPRPAVSPPSAPSSFLRRLAVSPTTLRSTWLRSPLHHRPALRPDVAIRCTRRPSRISCEKKKKKKKSLSEKKTTTTAKQQKKQEQKNTIILCAKPHKQSPRTDELLSVTTVRTTEYSLQIQIQQQHLSFPSFVSRLRVGTAKKKNHTQTHYTGRTQSPTSSVKADTYQTHK